MESSPQARYGHTLSSYYEFQILFGGISANGEYLNDLWVFTLTGKAGTWIKVAHQSTWPEGTAFASANVIRDKGLLYLIGGVH
jgi:hypothetical protein